MHTLETLRHLVDHASQIILIGVIPLLIAVAELLLLLSFLKRLVREHVGHALKTLIEELWLTCRPIVRAVRERVSRKKHRGDGPE
jgi:hypothetical protein